MRRARLPKALAAVGLLTVACTVEPGIISTPSPVLQPVVDSAPYVCSLIPEQAFRLVSGVTGPLAGETDGDERNGDCRTSDTTSLSLEVWWMQEGSGMTREHLSFLLNDRREVYSRHDGVVLPTELGEGMAAHLSDPPSGDQPYQVSAKFQCGGKERLIDIFLPQVAMGRDAIKDLIALMRIAQKRYGELYDCTPGP
ncbi:hypothetical protein ACWGH8_15645 [Nonomuraea muscovyensis]|uniref:DUF3558 domain-containing protein n=1 Tax=Nonomuraea muscovyensis TaxID=1124761 RepID=A0A7X0BXL1_9ACTN|nr:hypothetical protein [Nonomuraea muscovyensis]MBB6344503.1 hypothetical protein [Nonomuraea muscovyensis]